MSNQAIAASVEKIYTTSTALLRLGPTATFATSILGVGSQNPEGVWDGTLYLRGRDVADTMQAFGLYRVQAMVASPGGLAE